MRIAVISDTHDNLVIIKKFKKEILSVGIDYIVHLGDFTSPFAFKEVFSGFEGKGAAVLGNNDGEAFLMARFAEKMNIKLFNHPAILELDGLRFLLMHGFGDSWFTLDFARSLAVSGKYDIVLFGHTHSFYMEKIGDIVLLNPGEAGGWLTGKSTIALLDTSNKTVSRVEI
ncbi:MAG: metallophosphoesterase [Fervidicoccaceae archaeon]